MRLRAERWFGGDGGSVAVDGEGWAGESALSLAAEARVTLLDIGERVVCGLLPARAGVWRCVEAARSSTKGVERCLCRRRMSLVGDAAGAMQHPRGLMSVGGWWWCGWEVVVCGSVPLVRGRSTCVSVHCPHILLSEDDVRRVTVGTSDLFTVEMNAGAAAQFRRVMRRGEVV